jgi:hypothetical protein
LDEWRHALKGGITFSIDGSNVVITGGIDDMWVSSHGEFIVVDYKATSKAGEVTIDADWQIGYKRQMEIYQWLFAKNGYKVSPTGYFVYCNGLTDRQAFDARLEFEVKIIPYKGDISWVAETVEDAIDCLKSDLIPESGEDCDYCKYHEVVSEVEKVKSQEENQIHAAVPATPPP